ncbi:MAG TPA: hypothetical protein VHT53_13610 [Candidatus Elarobacter sp.]|nr:hypothetical protein [Candidatus Elarobacter sp.]
MNVLVRAHAWWYNKVPISFATVLLLLDGRRASWGGGMALLAVVLTVCAVGNYGYALNDLFDLDEDARAGRVNAAAGIGVRRSWAIVAASAACAVAFGALAAGIIGAAITLLELCLPLAYSVPPLRVKERGWLGVVADALAAHVYPAVLALFAVAAWTGRPIGTALAACAVAWSAAAGLRGILTHLLHTAERDRRAGLRTIVDAGALRLERLITALLLPIELLGFGGMLVLCRVGPVLWIGVALYLAYETFMTADGRFSVIMFRPSGQRYVPFVEERFYKSWAPLVLALDAARIDLLYLLAVPLYVVLFRRHLVNEAVRVRGVMSALRSRATARGARSNGGS